MSFNNTRKGTYVPVMNNSNQVHEHENVYEKYLNIRVVGASFNLLLLFLMRNLKFYSTKPENIYGKIVGWSNQMLTNVAEIRTSIKSTADSVYETAKNSASFTTFKWYDQEDTNTGKTYPKCGWYYDGVYVDNKILNENTMKLGEATIDVLLDQICYRISSIGRKIDKFSNCKFDVTVADMISDNFKDFTKIYEESLEIMKDMRNSLEKNKNTRAVGKSQQLQKQITNTKSTSNTNIKSTSNTKTVPTSNTNTTNDNSTNKSTNYPVPRIIVYDTPKVSNQATEKLSYAKVVGDELDNNTTPVTTTAPEEESSVIIDDNIIINDDIIDDGNDIIANGNDMVSNEICVVDVKHQYVSKSAKKRAARKARNQVTNPDTTHDTPPDTTHKSSIPSKNTTYKIRAEVLNEDKNSSTIVKIIEMSQEDYEKYF